MSWLILGHDVCHTAPDRILSARWFLLPQPPVHFRIWTISGFSFCFIAGLSYSHIKYTPLSWQSTQSNKIYLGKGAAWTVYSTFITNCSRSTGEPQQTGRLYDKLRRSYQIKQQLYSCAARDMPHACNVLLTFLCWHINFTVVVEVGGGVGVGKDKVFIPVSVVKERWIET